MTDDIITIGVSSCLLGTKVRFDGGHKRDRFVTDVFGGFVRYVPVCPEVEVGMPIPRETIRLEGDAENPRLVGNKTGEDWTERMETYSEKRAAKRDMSSLSGYILKKDSPSCGMERVKVYAGVGAPAKKGIGLFARELMRRYPHLPVEEEGRLNDPILRENFIIRVFSYHGVRKLFSGRFSRGAVVAFHTAHKFLLLAHSEKHYRQLGKLVATIKTLPPEKFRDTYIALFMEGLSLRATVRKNTNVLQHIVGFLRDHVTDFDRQNIVASIDDYHKELVPLIVPITLISHFARKYDIPYIKDQVYLNPHPKELMLRNHV